MQTHTPLRLSLVSDKGDICTVEKRAGGGGRPDIFQNRGHHPLCPHVSSAEEFLVSFVFLTNVFCPLCLCPISDGLSALCFSFERPDYEIFA